VSCPVEFTRDLSALGGAGHAGWWTRHGRSTAMNERVNTWAAPAGGALNLTHKGSATACGAPVIDVAREWNPDEL